MFATVKNYKHKKNEQAQSSTENASVIDQTITGPVDLKENDMPLWWKKLNSELILSFACERFERRDFCFPTLAKRTLQTFWHDRQNSAYFWGAIWQEWAKKKVIKFL